jgi:hypothetical protein
MGMVDDLKSLEELHAKGRLTDEEFASAKAAIISGKPSFAPPGSPAVTGNQVKESSAPKRKPTSLGRVVRITIGVAVLLCLAWVYVQQETGHIPVTTALKVAARMPLDLRDETFGIPASSWKGISITVPYDGSLTVSMQVSRGNPMEVFLTDGSGIQQLKATRQCKYIGSFYSTKGTSFQHTERIGQGVYYLVVRDNSLGILSASSSDISIKAHVDP